MYKIGDIVFVCAGFGNGIVVDYHGPNTVKIFLFDSGTTDWFSHYMFRVINV